MRFSGQNSVFDTPLWQAATQLAPVEMPKVRPKQQGYPGFAVSVTPSASVLRRDDRGLANADILNFRTESDTRKLVMQLMRSNPDLSAAASAYLRVALTQSYKIRARNMDGSFNRDATSLAMQLVLRWDLVPNYVEDGFSQTSSVRSLAESLGFEMLGTGAMCSELVLDKARMPAKVAALPVTQLKFYQDDKGLRPVQVVGGQQIDLDFPTVFYTSIDQPLLTAYSNSPFESSIQPVLMDTDYLNDLRRVLKRAIHRRLQAIIDTEKVQKMAPPEAQSDPDAMSAFFNQMRADIESMVNGLNPEDAIVSLDAVEYSYVEGGTGDVPNVIEVIQSLINAKMATGSKTLPSVLGHGAGTQNVASSETLLFMKTSDGVIRSKLNEHFSKILTLAVRLTGQDVAVYFEYDPIELRPTSELEAFYAMKQSRVLELLSLGFYGDDEASIELIGQLTPAGFSPLSGTRFYSAAPGGAGGGNNPYSGTSNGGAGGGALNQSLKPGTPKKAGGKSQ
jgi:hypothetical protein